MNDCGQIKLWLKEAGLYLQFLNEDIDSINSIRGNVASRIAEMLKEATKNLREAVSLLNREIKEAKKR